MGLIIALIIIGLVLLLAEILLIPGVGFAGILGVLSMGGSCYIAFHDYGTTTGLIVLAIIIAILILFLIWVLRAKTWKKMTLETNIDSKAVSSDPAVLAVGDCGRTLTRLAPMGSARFGDYVIEVKAVEGMLDPNVDVRVVLIEDNKIYVKPL